ncbi:MAG: tetratricopeptide repeat protein [Cytophagaceae bacterium]
MRYFFPLAVLFIITISAASGQNLNNWREEYDSCKVWFNNGKVKNSISWLEKFTPQFKLVSEEDTLMYYEMVHLLGRCYLKLGMHSDAEDQFKEDLEFFKSKPQVINKSTYTASVVYLGFLYYNMRHYDKAEFRFAEAAKLKEAEGKIKTKPTLIILNNLATLANTQKKYEKADSVYTRLTSLKKEVYGTHHPEYVNTRQTHGFLQFKMGRYQEAEKMLKECLDINTKIHGEKSAQYVATLNFLGRLYEKQGRYKDLEDLYIKALAISREIFPKENLELTKSIHHLASLYRTIGRYKEAEPLFLEILDIRDQTIGQNNLDYTSALINVALLYKMMGDYNQAEIYFMTAMSIYEVIIGEFHESYVAALINLAGLYRNMGRLDQAEPLYLKSLQIYKTTTGENNPNFAVLLNNIGLFYDEVGRYEQAEASFKKALEITKRLEGENTAAYATTLNNLAFLYKNIGHFEQSEPIYLYSAKIRKEILGENTIEYAGSLNNLAELYESMGRADESEALYNKSLNIIKGLFGTMNPYYADVLNNLAGLYKNAKKYKQSEQLFTEALNIIKITLGEKHHDYATTLNNLALLQQQTGNFKQAEELFLQNIEKTKQSLGPKHPNYAASLSNLAGLYEHMAKYDKAEKLYQEALNIKKEVLKPNHPAFGPVYMNMGRLFTAENKLERADSCYNAGINNYLHQIQKYFPSMSEKEKGQFYNNIAQELERYNSFVLKRGVNNPEVYGSMFNNQLATKALLLNSSNKLRQRIFNSKDTSLISLYKKWLSQKEHLSKVYTLTNDEIQKQKINVDSLEKAANDVEKKLSLRSELFKNTNEIQNYSWKDIQKKLKDDEAAIEIIRFAHFKFDSAGTYTDSVYYAALIVTGKDKHFPRMVLMKEGLQMENKYLKYYKNCIRFQMQDTLSYKMFWSKIHKELTNVSKVYVSPDGVYNSINLNTLLNPQTSAYLLDEMEIHNISNSKDLLTPKSGKKAKNIAVLAGNPNYVFETTVSTVKDTKREATIASLLNPLPGTREEIKKLSETLNKNGWQTTVYAEENASEKNLKALDHPKIVHIATHGFFEKDTDGGSSENPLLRSGLMLAGASVTLYNKSNTIYNPEKMENDYEDGILTAYEAMNLNLEGTDLVVLSACETGLGEVKNGEGVYGLQRSFIIAGAQSVVISLWKVNDETTQKLMTLFYQELMKTPNKKKAFFSAQTKLKQEFSDPYFWGAFIMIGG